MARFRALILLVLSGVCGALMAAPAGLVVTVPPGEFVTLCFHDIVPSGATSKDAYATPVESLVRWFDWMKGHGWHPVSMQQIIDAHNGGTPLPPNAVLLSFDDGLESSYSQVYPLLEAYHYPALFALETGWLRRVNAGSNVAYAGERPPGGAQPKDKHKDEVLYNKEELGAKGFVSWAQVREMQASGLVEFATHTDNLHDGILANPEGNLEPAAITHLYDPATHRYESNAEYRQRIRDDLARSMRIIQAHTGRRPRVVVWPYGAATRESIDIAHAVGLPISFSLADRHISGTRDLGNLGRLLVMGDPQPDEIESQIEQSIAPRPQVQRAVQVDLDYIYDPNPAQVNRNLGALLDRIKAMNVSTVYLQAFADPNGDGNAEALYFPNRYLPMRADLFNRVAWQLQTRAGVHVYAWLPLLAYDLPDKALQQRLDVKVFGANGKPAPSHDPYRRLSPFLPQSLDIVSGIYADLARNTSSIDGVLIHDDAMLEADEDASSCDPQARWPGTDRAIADCHLDARRKTEALIDFGKVAITRMRYYTNVSEPFRTARNLYARVVMDPAAEARFAQALAPFLANYDEVVLMAMPYLDGTDQPPSAWLAELERKVAAHPGALRKVVFELQTRDWRGKGRWIKGDVLLGWMRQLVRAGALNLAYYPDDFLNNEPPFKPTFIGMSLNDFPQSYDYTQEKGRK